MKPDDDQVLRDRLSDALRRARVPLAAMRCKIGDTLPDKAAKPFLAKGASAWLTQRMDDGRGWIIEGAPVRAYNATLAVMKAALLLGVPCVYFDGLDETFHGEVEEGVASVGDASLIGISRFYDPSYKGYPHGDAIRFKAERALLRAMNSGKAVLVHCTGRFSNCNWYSPEVLTRLSDGCERMNVE